MDSADSEQPHGGGFLKVLERLALTSEGPIEASHVTVHDLAQADSKNEGACRAELEAQGPHFIGEQSVIVQRWVFVENVRMSSASFGRVHFRAACIHYISADPRSGLRCRPTLRWHVRIVGP